MITVLKIIEDYEKQTKNVALLGHSNLAYRVKLIDLIFKARKFNFESDYILGVDSSTSGTKVTVSDVAEWVKKGHSVRWTLSNTNLRGKLDIFSSHDLDLMYSRYPEIKKLEEAQARKYPAREYDYSNNPFKFTSNAFKVYGLKG